jgi:hypothetical protein
MHSRHTKKKSPQFPNSTIVFHRQIDHDSQLHVQCIKNPHPEGPFAQIGDDTIEALTKLAETFKNKFQKVQNPGLSNAPAKAAETKSLPIYPIQSWPLPCVNTSGKAGAQIPQLPLGDDSSPWGR